MIMPPPFHNLFNSICALSFPILSLSSLLTFYIFSHKYNKDNFIFYHLCLDGHFLRCVGTPTPWLLIPLEFPFFFHLPLFIMLVPVHTRYSQQCNSWYAIKGYHKCKDLLQFVELGRESI